MIIHKHSSVCTPIFYKLSHLIPNLNWCMNFRITRPTEVIFTLRLNCQLDLRYAGLYLIYIDSALPWIASEITSLLVPLSNSLLKCPTYAVSAGRPRIEKNALWTNSTSLNIDTSFLTSTSNSQSSFMTQLETCIPAKRKCSTSVAAVKPVK